MTAKGPDYLASVRLLTRFLDGSRLLLGGALVAAAIGSLCEILPIWLLTEAIRNTTDGSFTLGNAMQMAVAMLGAITACFAATCLSASLAHMAAFRAIFLLRIALVEHMAVVPLGVLNRHGRGDAKRLVLDDPDGLEGVLAHGLPDAAAAFCLWATISIWLLLVDWLTGLIAILPSILGLAALAIAMRRSAGLAMDFQAASKRMNASIVEMISGIAVLKVFRAGIGTRGPRTAVRDLTRAQTAMSMDYIPFGTVFTTLIAANVAFILPVGLIRVDQGVLYPADLFFVIVLGAGYSQPLLKLFAQFHRLASISLGSTLAGDLLATVPQYNSRQVHALANYDVVFDRVTFAYDAEPVLQDVSFAAPQACMTALVGPSGAGKTTIAHLVPRLFDIASGSILIGGVDIRNLSLAQLYKTVALVPQDPFLFNDTLFENIKIGNREASAAEVFAAARRAQLADFVERLPDGLQTRLGRGGILPSGGERQRIAIARLLLKDAPVVILDEATAFSDAENELALMKAIDALAARRTVLVIAHRLETVRRAAQILVVDRGRVCERGTHEALLSRNGLYARLSDTAFQSQQPEASQWMPEM